MAKRFRPGTPAQSYLLPPSPAEWLPEHLLAYFVLEVREELDLGAIERVLQSKDARGARPYPPRMVVALLPYAYSTGRVLVARHRARDLRGRHLRAMPARCRWKFRPIKLTVSRNPCRSECSRFRVDDLEPPSIALGRRRVREALAPLLGAAAQDPDEENRVVHASAALASAARLDTGDARDALDALASTIVTETSGLDDDERMNAHTILDHFLRLGGVSC